MKKLIILLSLTLFLSSCSKTHTCTCIIELGGTKKRVSEKIKGTSKSKAESECNRMNGGYPGASVSCSLN